MSLPNPRVLVVDDEELWHRTYRLMLGPDGYTLGFAQTRDEALAQLSAAPWDVVVLDRKLQQSSDAPDQGLDLLDEIRRQAPLAKTIVVTGYPDQAGVVRSFEHGAWDHLEKNSYVDVLLRIKVRQALADVRERQLAALGNGHREESLRDLWAKVQTESDRHEKGRLLEQFLLLLFRSIPGFDNAAPNQRSADEEFDIVIPNASTDALWSKEGIFLLVEAKNWSSPVGPDEFDRFRSKIERRFDRCRLGFFVAVGGVTDGFRQHVAAERKGKILVIVLDGNDLEALLTAADRNGALKALHARAAIGK